MCGCTYMQKKRNELKTLKHDDEKKKHHNTAPTSSS